MAHGETQSKQSYAFPAPEPFVNIMSFLNIFIFLRGVPLFVCVCAKGTENKEKFLEHS